MQFGLRLGSSFPKYLGVSENYFDAMTVAPPVGVRYAIDKTVRRLDALGVLSSLDWLSIHALHDEQAARINLVNPAQIMSAVDTPTFTAYEGWTGNGSSSYLNTGWNPVDDAVNFAQDDASMGVWCLTNVTGTVVDIGNGRARINSRSGTTTPCYPNQTTAFGPTLASSTSIGMRSWDRTAADATEVYQDGTSLGTDTTASATLNNADFFIGAYNQAGTPTSYSTRQIAATFWGASLGDAGHAALHAQLNEFLTTVGG